MRFSFLNLNELEKQDLKNENGFILDTNINYQNLHRDDILFENTIYSRQFGIEESDPQEVLNFLYTCGCEELTGQINEGKICEQCEGKVKKNEFSIEKRSWAVLRPYKILTYMGLLYMETIFTKKNFKKFLSGKLKGVLLKDMYDNFEEILVEHGKSDKSKEIKFLVDNKEDVFTSYIPVISKKTRPMLKSQNIIPHYTMLDDLNSLYTSISGDIQMLREYCDSDSPKLTQSLLSAIQKKYYHIGNTIVDKIGGGKDKMLRDEIYATRLPFTARAVIVPLVTHRLDVCTIPYDTFRGLYRKEILSYLTSSGEPFNRALKFVDINRSTTKYDRDILDDILENHIVNNHILINRQPTLKFESTKSLEIISLEQENVLRVPSVLLDGWNGDHKNIVTYNSNN